LSRSGRDNCALPAGPFSRPCRPIFQVGRLSFRIQGSAHSAWFSKCVIQEESACERGHHIYGLATIRPSGSRLTHLTTSRSDAELRRTCYFVRNELSPELSTSRSKVFGVKTFPLGL